MIVSLISDIHFNALFPEAPLRFCRALLFQCLVSGLCLGSLFAQSGLQSSDLYKLRSVGEAQLSPDGARLAYTIITYGETGRPYSQLWLMNVADGKSFRIG